MCFSASASFAAGATLSAVSIATVRLAARRKQIPFAVVPLLFGVQQFIEGFLWLSFRQGSQLPNGALTMAFSVFSHLLWPIFLPFAVMLVEPSPRRRGALAVVQAIGLFVAAYLLSLFVRFGVTSRVAGHHIAYDSQHFFAAPLMSMYLISTCGACLLSTSRWIRAFGVLLSGSFVVSYLIQSSSLWSIWCFFAAILSAIVYLNLESTRRAALHHQSLGAPLVAD